MSEAPLKWETSGGKNTRIQNTDWLNSLDSLDSLDKAEHGLLGLKHFGICHHGCTKGSLWPLSTARFRNGSTRHGKTPP